MKFRALFAIVAIITLFTCMGNEALWAGDRSFSYNGLGMRGDASRDGGQECPRGSQIMAKCELPQDPAKLLGLSIGELGTAIALAEKDTSEPAGNEPVSDEVTNERKALKPIFDRLMTLSSARDELWRVKIRRLLEIIALLEQAVVDAKINIGPILAALEYAYEKEGTPDAGPRNSPRVRGGSLMEQDLKSEILGYRDKIARSAETEVDLKGRLAVVQSALRKAETEIQVTTESIDRLLALRDKAGRSTFQRLITYWDDKKAVATMKLIIDEVDDAVISRRFYFRMLGEKPAIIPTERFNTIKRQLQSMVALGCNDGVAALLRVGADVYAPAGAWSPLALSVAFGEANIGRHLRRAGGEVSVPWDSFPEHPSENDKLRMLGQQFARVQGFFSSVSFGGNRSEREYYEKLLQYWRSRLNALIQAKSAEGGA